MIIKVGMQFNYIKAFRFSTDFVHTPWKGREYQRAVLHLGPIAFFIAWCHP